MASAPASTTTRLLSAPRAARLVAHVGLAECLRGLLATLQEDFARWDDFVLQPRVAHHVPGGVIELMPVSDGTHYAFKFVNGHPGNTALGLPTVMAFGALAEVRTGIPTFLADLTLATALRTAATSALAARHLARPDSRCMALIGTGSQGAFQALAFAVLLGVRELRLYDPDPSAMQHLAQHLRSQQVVPSLDVVTCTSASEAVRGADIVTTATAAKCHAEVLADADVAPGTHINAVGGDCPGKTELPLALLRRARLVVEYQPQTRIEGELQRLPRDWPVTELWELVQGRRPGREHDQQITIFDSVGFALEDYSTLRYLQAQGQAAGLLEPLALLPQLADPKDLFQQLLAPAPNPHMTEPYSP